MKFLITIGSFLLIASVSGGIIPPPPGTQCLSENGQGLGLGPAIREMVDLIPMEKLIEIYLVAVSNDDEVIQVMEFITSEEFIKIVSVMQNTKEFSQILEYFCEELHFDAYYYLNGLGGLMGFPQVTRPPKIFTSGNIKSLNTKRRSGFNGMLQDWLNALPTEQIKQTYLKRYQEDAFLRLAMDKLKSEDFRVIGDAIEDLDEYKDMLQRLRNIGVDVDKILKVVMNFMGWRPHQPLRF